MRLFNVLTLQIDSGFPDVDTNDTEHKLWYGPDNGGLRPKYSILSHVWAKEEVTFQTFDQHKHRLAEHTNSNGQYGSMRRWGEQDASTIMPSIHKITGVCKQVRAASAGQNAPINHVWIDTVCINKDDVNETQLAINSMFRWYAEAELCYVYLADVSWNQADSMQQFRASRWFLRGWTLQELLASREVQFYDRDWQYMGSKNDLVGTISEAANIDPQHLLGGFRTASLGQKMSWLARRETKHIEDRAYCMLGIFGVFLEPRYGQGGREFTRLQAEIVRTWDENRPFDETLFAWKSDSVVSSGLFAPAPMCFQHCSDLIYIPEYARRRNMRREIGGTTSEGIALHASHQITIQVPYSHGLPEWVYLLTCGITAWCTMVPKNAIENHAQSRDMQLNCWRRTENGLFQAAKIKMWKRPNGTWQRVHCGNVLWSNSLKLYPPWIVASVSAVLLQVPNQVEFRR
ncbi:HET-domain-containing protein [Stemphylium lycopersici]|nr:HET-domain-containing protein [Stemphylium lycopersici]